MIDWKFTAVVAALTGSLSAAGWLLVRDLSGGLEGVLLGAVFSLTGFLFVHHWLRSAAQRGGGAFTTAVFGGFLGRMVALLSLAGALGITSGVHVPTALLTIVTLHFVVSPIEIIHLDRSKALR